MGVIVAIDTVSKRRSILGLCSPTVRPLPIPDGTFSQGDRQHLALMYSGINLAEASGSVNSLIGLAGMRPRLEGLTGQRSRLEGLTGTR